LLGGWSSLRKLGASEFRRTLSATNSDDRKSPSRRRIFAVVEQYESAQATTGKMRCTALGSPVWRAATASSNPARFFSTSTAREATWGFVGLGAMGMLENKCKPLRWILTSMPGYPMAKNLRAKIPETDTLIICDTNPDATKRFVEEAGM
jgi:hypothetical protein